MIAVVLTLVLGGSLAFERIHDEVVRSRVIPRYGTLVDIAPDRQLFVQKAGQLGESVILIESGLAGMALLAKPLGGRLGASSQVISYDRFTNGLSQAPYGDRPSLSQAALDTSNLLKALGIKEPITYVGYSMGAVYAGHFASNYPEKVKALILIDPPVQDETLLPPEVVEKEFYSFRRVLRYQSLSSMVGIPRLRQILSSEADQADEALIPLSHRHLTTSYEESLVMHQMHRQVSWERLPTNLPILVLSSGLVANSGTGMVHDFHRRIVEGRPNSRQLTLMSADHRGFLSPARAPEVAALIRDFQRQKL